MVPRLSIFLLGPFHVVWDVHAPGERLVTGFSTDKERALLAYLACETDRPHRRDELAGLLWPEMPNQVARTNLRLTLHRLRQTIGDVDAPGEAILFIDRESIWLNPDACQSDVAAFEALLDEVKKYSPCKPEHCAGCLPCLEQAIALYRGDFLQGFALDDNLVFSEWALLKREWLRRRAVDGMYRLAECHRQRGNHESALYYARKQLELDPWREEAHRQVMNILAHHGEFSAALSQYETCQQTLARELGVSPDEETVALRERILAARSMRRRSLPLQPTPLVGRQAELSQVLERLAHPACRLVTICGPGGIGKTRLALQAAEQRRSAYLHGVAFIPLVGVTPDFLAVAIANTLEISLSGQRNIEQQVVDYLRDKEMLLLLDSFEHLLKRTSLLTEIIQTAPEVTLLVTSRQRLALQAEWLIDLRGLDYPPDGDETSLATDDPQAYERYEAVQLFVQRARQARSGFTLSPETGNAVVRICRLVEGWPLAIELAAAAVRTRNCAEILAEMESDLAGIKVPFRDISERHRSVWAAFDYSWRLLEPFEAQGLSRLSVFRGGFVAEAAAQVAGLSVEALAALGDKSLLFRDDTGRYSLHELTRQYAGQKLRFAGEMEATRSGHLAYYRDVAERAREEMLGPKLAAWSQWFNAESDNLRAALEWACCGGSAEDGLRLAVILWRFWSLRGYLAEGLGWLERLIPLAGAVPEAVRAQAQRCAGTLACNLGDFDRAALWLMACLALYRRQDSPRGIAATLNDLGMLETDQGHFEQAEAYYTEGLAICRELNEKHSLALVLYNLGWLAALRDDPQRAMSLCEESLALGRELGDERIISYALCGLGQAVYGRGEIERAKGYYLASLALKQKLEDRYSLIWPLMGLAHVFMVEGQAMRAVQFLGAMGALLETLGVSLPPAYRAQHEEIIARLRAQLDPASFAQAWREGGKMSINHWCKL